MSRENMVNVWEGVLFSFLKEGNYVTHYNMDKPGSMDPWINLEYAMLSRTS